jgi:hypothetical protein
VDGSYPRTVVQYDPKGVQAFKAVQTPKAGADLYQFLSAMNWMRTSIPNFALLMASTLYCHS